MHEVCSDRRTPFWAGASGWFIFFFFFWDMKDLHCARKRGEKGIRFWRIEIHLRIYPILHMILKHQYPKYDTHPFLSLPFPSFPFPFLFPSPFPLYSTPTSFFLQRATDAKISISSHQRALLLCFSISISLSLPLYKPPGMIKRIK